MNEYKSETAFLHFIRTLAYSDSATALAKKLGINRDEASGKIMAVWMHFYEHGSAERIISGIDNLKWFAKQFENDELLSALEEIGLISVKYARWKRTSKSYELTFNTPHVVKFTPIPSDMIVSHDLRRYSIGNYEPIQVTPVQDEVLQAFTLAQPLTTEELVDFTMNKRAPRVLSEIAKKYDRRFAPAIVLPGVRCAGGYRVKITCINDGEIHPNGERSD